MMPFIASKPRRRRSGHRREVSWILCFKVFGQEGRCCFQGSEIEAEREVKYFREQVPVIDAPCDVPPDEISE